MGLVKGLSIDDEVNMLDKISEHEQVVFCNDPESGLKAIIAIHNTTLGPALGGCRMHPYESLTDALDDVLRLSKGMSYKCAAADVDFGGGKAVIIGDPLTDKTPELFRAFGQFVDSLGGRFYTGTDMGTNMEDFVHAMRETRNIVGVPEAYGGGGDSSVPTALGVIYGIQATNQTLFHTDDLNGRTYAVQGLGKVGFKVTERLLEAGASVSVTDVSEEKLQAIQHKASKTNGTIRIVNSDEIYSQEVDVFIPCAVGGVINDHTINQLKAKAIVGSANNQLESEEHGKRLAERGILYAPDYIVNAGGLIQVADELYGANKERVLAKTKEIYHVILEVYQQAEIHQQTTNEAANRICEKIISDKAKRNSFYTRTVRPKWDIR